MQSRAHESENVRRASDAVGLTLWLRRGAATQFQCCDDPRGGGATHTTDLFQLRDIERGQALERSRRVPSDGVRDVQRGPARGAAANEDREQLDDGQATRPQRSKSFAGAFRVRTAVSGDQRGLGGRSHRGLSRGPMGVDMGGWDAWDAPAPLEQHPHHHRVLLGLVVVVLANTDLQEAEPLVQFEGPLVGGAHFEVDGLDVPLARVSENVIE